MRKNHSETASLAARLQPWFHRDWLVLSLYLLATFAFTYPLIVRMGGSWMPFSGDMYMKLWDVWWLENLVQTGQPFYFSQDLFYPIGLDLSFHPTSWTTTAFVWLLAQIVGLFSAYKISILLAVFTSAYAAYLLALWLSKQPIAAWFAGIIYAFAPYHIADIRSHPDLAQLAPIPITILFFLQAFTKLNFKKAILAGLMLGLVAWTGLYLFAFTAITLGFLFFLAAVTNQHWAQKRYWLVSLVFALSSLILLLPRLYPIFNDSQSLSYVIEEKFIANETQADALALLVPPVASPIFAPITGKLSALFAESEDLYPSPYLGWLAILAASSALFWPKHRKQAWLWLAIAALFLILSLGPVLRFGGIVRPNRILPASFLLDIELFRSIRPNLFHIGFLLPFAVLVAYGIAAWLSQLKPNPKRLQAAIILLSLFMFAEYWIGNAGMGPLEVSPFYEKLNSEEGDFALIDLPMGYSPSKRYLFLQSLHGRPIAEGMSSRMPPNAFDYIESNPLLARWQNLESLDCDQLATAEYALALNHLQADGFRYLLLHDKHDSFTSYLETVPKSYEDEFVVAYSLADMRTNPPCPSD